MKKTVSRAQEKLSFALANFKIDVESKICADFGASTGGFVECLLSAGASKVYAVDTAYGELAYKLRLNSQVIVMERTNAMHVDLPERCDLISIDTGWTPQRLILTNAVKNLKSKGEIVSLIKPHYEAEKFMLTKGKLEEKFLNQVIEKVKNDIKLINLEIKGWIKSPIKGKSSQNTEYLAYLVPTA
jgi:23S rRNA (cytidine1920-2'-O)/16S rRNA (cytidine1409-2'-O)-methyltransferase